MERQLHCVENFHSVESCSASGSVEVQNAFRQVLKSRKLEPFWVYSIDVHAVDLGMDYSLLKELSENLEMDLDFLSEKFKLSVKIQKTGSSVSTSHFELASVALFEASLSIATGELQKEVDKLRLGNSDVLQLSDGYMDNSGALHRGDIPAEKKSEREARVWLNYSLGNYRVHSKGFDLAFAERRSYEPADILQVEVDTRNACQFLEEILRRRITEDARLDAAFNKLFVKVVIGCGVRLWFKVSLLVLLKRLGLPDHVQTLELAIGTSLLHVALGAQPYLQGIWGALGLRVVAKQKKFASVFVLLCPVWMSLVRLLGIVVCPSMLFNFSSLGCVDEHDFVVTGNNSADEHGFTVAGNSSTAAACPKVGWLGCLLSYAEVVGSAIAVVGGYFAWKAWTTKSRDKQEKGEPLLGATCLEEHASVEEASTANQPARGADDFDKIFKRWIRLMGSVEFAAVPGFLYLGFNQYVELGQRLIYVMYVVVCIATYWITALLASSHSEVQEAWSTKWRERLQVPVIGIKVPISPLCLTFLSCIPAFTDNCMLSLAIGDTQSIWMKDQRLQCTWQRTWQNMPILRTSMACVSLPQTLGVLMVIGLFLHIHTFIRAMDANPRAAAEVASLNLLGQIHEVHAVVVARDVDKKTTVTSHYDDDIVY